MKTQELPARAKTTGIHLKRIMVPLDFSPLSKKALQYAMKLAQEFNADMTLFHVAEPAPASFEGMMVTFSNGNGSEPKKKLNALANSARAGGVEHVTVTFRRGFPSHEIVEAAKELDVDLIVIATHGYTGWKHFCMGSTAERVVRAAPCPVLVVRQKEHEFC
jgi:nucleotide-binding universal stress UspA family protein